MASTYDICLCKVSGHMLHTAGLGGHPPCSYHDLMGKGGSYTARTGGPDQNTGLWMSGVSLAHWKKEWCISQEVIIGWSTPTATIMIISLLDFAV